MKTAVKPQVNAGKKVPAGRPIGKPAVASGRGTQGTVSATAAEPAAATAPAGRRRNFTPLTPMRQQAAKSMRKLADQMAAARPDAASHDHVRDAARRLDAGDEEGAQRHLRAAVFSLTPQSLHRNGEHDDTAHVAARQAMHGVHRHLLLVKDIADTKQANDSARPAQVPAAPAPGPAVPSPVSVPQPQASKQFTKDEVHTVTELTGRLAAGDWDGLCAVIEMAGPPYRYRHGWIKIASGSNLPPIDRAVVQGHKADARNDAIFTEPAHPGSAGHAAELRSLATEMDGVAGRNYLSLKDSHEGMPSDTSARERAGVGADAPPESDGSRVLRRAATMIDRGQPSIARLHSASVRDAARTEARGNPDLQERLNAAADKLDLLPKRSGLAKLPRANADFKERTAAARAYAARPKSTGLANTYAFSAQTAALEQTPAPYGKPGGPGLYGKKGNKHSDYFEQIVQALMAKRGMDESQASQIAWGVLRKWARGGGGVHPEVSAAAARALGQEAAAGAGGHSHTVSWDLLAAVVELAFNPAELRVTAGPGGGQFTAGGAAGASAAGTQAKPAAAPKQTPAQKAAAAKAAAHAKHVAHVAHVAHVNKVSTQKAELLVTAADDRQKADGLIKQRTVLEKELASASGKTSTGQSGSTTAANATTSSTAPKTTAPAASTKAAATPSTAAAPAASPASSSTTAAKTSTASTTASSTASKTASATASASAGKTAQVKAQIASLNTQIAQLLAAAEQATLQASKMS